jgi:pimeloyl-ACP methyl ester carboxylesterase
VGGVGVFYREAGPRDAPTIVLLHGFPSSSRMFETLIPLLATRYHLIAPDYPGFASAAFANEGYALFSLSPEDFEQVFATHVLGPPEATETAQWQFISNRQPTLIMLETVEATSQVISRGDTYIGFFDDDI